MSKNDEPTADTVFKLFKGGKEQDNQPNAVPVNTYEITLDDGTTHVATGFLIFTAQHVAVMRDEGDGAIPVLVMPLHRLQMALLSDEVDAD